MLRRPAARYRWNGSPRVRGGSTSTEGEFSTWARGRLVGIRRILARRWMEWSSSRSLSFAGLISNYGNEQVGDARGAYIAERRELLTIGTIEEQYAAPENLTLVNGLEGAGRGHLFGMHHHFQIARFEFFHAATENDATPVDEHQIGEDVLDLFHSMRRHHDGAAAIEVVV